QAFFVGDSPAQLQGRFGHRQGEVVTVLDLGVSVASNAGNRFGISIEASLLRRLAVIGPHTVATGALRHHADERWLLLCGANQRCELLTKLAAEVAGNKRR